MSPYTSVQTSQLQASQPQQRGRRGGHRGRMLSVLVLAHFIELAGLRRKSDIRKLTSTDSDKHKRFYMAFFFLFFFQMYMWIESLIEQVPPSSLKASFVSCICYVTDQQRGSDSPQSGNSHWQSFWELWVSWTQIQLHLRVVETQTHKSKIL